MAPNPNTQRLHDAGVSIWLDMISRDLLKDGDFANYISEYSVTGATSNPTIFAKALANSSLYDDQLKSLAAEGQNDSRELFFSLALDDIRDAARLLRPAYDAAQRSDGLISFECTPDLADDTEGTLAQAKDLWSRLSVPNVMIKVPGTEAGLPAIEQLTREGLNINITLLFSVARYEQVVDAYIRGLTARADAGEPIDHITSVASFFLSRIDTKVDDQLPEDSPLRGRVAVASARVAYQRFETKFQGPEWERLEGLGARRQKPLWASTGTKNKAYSDVMYVAELVGPDVVNTMPENTLHAFADHGEVSRTLDRDPEEAERILAQAAEAGIDLEQVTYELEREGVKAFDDSYTELSETIESEFAAVAGA
jgi:transaldolase